MEKHRFGRTGHMSTVAIFGAAAFWEIEQKDADRVMELVIEAGVNHIDVAPSYGQAEQRLGPWMKRERSRFFLGCKTMERTREGAWKELRESLERLQTEAFDLYQCHAVTSMDELDSLFIKGGAMEAMIEARDQGLTKYIGITGHGVDAPKIHLEALRRFDFDSVLFPLNFVQMANPEFRVNFVLSYDVTGLCTVGDIRILLMVLKACENYSKLGEKEREAMIESGSQFEALFK